MLCLGYGLANGLRNDRWRENAELNKNAKYLGQFAKVLVIYGFRFQAVCLNAAPLVSGRPRSKLDPGEGCRVVGVEARQYGSA